MGLAAWDGEVAEGGTVATPTGALAVLTDCLLRRHWAAL
jgi:hypothetical protein